MMFVSPLSRDSSARLLWSQPAKDVVVAWQSAFGIDVSAHLSGVERIELWECSETGLKFFRPPDAAGSAALYADLQKFPWYYMDDKWEHRTALGWLPGGASLLEVGCGSGGFLAQAIGTAGTNLAVGVEWNATAAKSWEGTEGIIVSDIAEALRLAPADGFDVVASFQVLEHSPDPKQLLREMVDAVRPGGSVILSVPNDDSFVGLDRFGLLNSPPHHMTRWRERTLRAVGVDFELDIMDLVHEPLQTYHIDYYVSVMLRHFARSWKSARAATFIGRGARKILMTLPSLRNMVRGHTILARFRRRTSRTQ